MVDGRYQIPQYHTLHNTIEHPTKLTIQPTPNTIPTTYTMFDSQDTFWWSLILQDFLPLTDWWRLEETSSFHRRLIQNLLNERDASHTPSCRSMAWTAKDRVLRQYILEQRVDSLLRVVSSSSSSSSSSPPPIERLLWNSGQCMGCSQVHYDPLLQCTMEYYVVLQKNNTRIVWQGFLPATTRAISLDLWNDDQRLLTEDMDDWKALQECLVVQEESTTTTTTTTTELAPILERIQANYTILILGMELSPLLMGGTSSPSHKTTTSTTLCPVIMCATPDNHHLAIHWKDRHYPIDHPLPVVPMAQGAFYPRMHLWMEKETGKFVELRLDRCSLSSCGTIGQFR